MKTSRSLLPGISVIIPASSSVDNLEKCLESCRNQSIDPSLFEVIVVLNGPRMFNNDVSSRFHQFGKVNLRVLSSSEPGASRARNIGLAAAMREYVTFLDDDDNLQPEFLRVGLDCAHPAGITLLPIADQVEGTSELSHENALNVRISAFKGQQISLKDIPWSLGFNACKIIDTSMAQSIRYDETLSSGEDVVYFSQFLAFDDIVVSVPRQSENSHYVRTLRAESVSRGKDDFDFNVTQRLSVIGKLQRIDVSDRSQLALDSLINSQFGFVQRFLKDNPELVTKAIEEAGQQGTTGLNWGPLRSEKARRLVFSYCFPPYADTSANVAAKLIRAQGELVDVYYSKMDRVRAQDSSTNAIVDPYVVHRGLIDKEPSFANWPLISAYALEAAHRASRRALVHGAYETMYSRALWSGSHVAATLYKKSHPQVTWEAEFSDPLTVGADGRKREGKITPGKTTRMLKKMLKKSNWPTVPWSSHFELTELITLIYADTVVFTNQNQQDVMLERYPRSLQQDVRARSEIRHHITPTPEMYSLTESNYSMPGDRVNIGYFGNFYANRGISDVLDALEALPETIRRDIRVHIFTSKPEEVRQHMSTRKSFDNVVLTEYVPYLEFLNISSQCDALVVTDADVTSTEFSKNPFLPSKYSDYIGAGVPVWGIINEGSPLSSLKLDHVSHSGDTPSAAEALTAIHSHTTARRKNRRREDL